MKENLLALLFGLMFGLGLIVAGMVNPDKVLAFLDVAGSWDPSLALVMASALLILGIAQRLTPKVCDIEQGESQPRPSHTAKMAVDWRLLAGSVIFGTGWGLSGICPGPAIVGLTSGLTASYVYATAMFAGFALFKFLHRR